MRTGRAYRMCPVIGGSPSGFGAGSDTCRFTRAHPGNCGSVWRASDVLVSASDKPRFSSTGGTARLAAEAMKGDWVPGKSLLSGAVATAKSITPATAAPDTMPPHWTTRAVHGRVGLSTVRRRTSSQLDCDGALPSTRSRSARRRLFTSARSMPTSSLHSAQDCMWARYGSERDPSSSPKAK